MRKSEAYKAAMVAVMLDCETLETEEKLDVLSVLMKDKELAEFSEREEAAE